MITKVGTAETPMCARHPNIPEDPSTHQVCRMRLLGTVEVMTNKRVTLPNKLLESLKAKGGDFLLFYEDDSGKIVVKMEKG